MPKQRKDDREDVCTDRHVSEIFFLPSQSPSQNSVSMRVRVSTYIIRYEWPLSLSRIYCSPQGIAGLLAIQRHLLSDSVIFVAVFVLQRLSQ